MNDKTNTITSQDEPIVILAPEVESQIEMYTDLVDTEIGGFGFVTAKDGYYFVSEIFLVPQEVSGSEVDYEDTAGLAYAIEFAVAQDRLDELRFAWHSHVNMGVFWSGTDDKFCKDLGITTDWFLNLVVNKRGQRKARLDTFMSAPGLPRLQRTFDDLIATRDLATTVKAYCEEQIEKFVTKAKPTQKWTNSYDSTKDKKGTTAPQQAQARALPHGDTKRHEELMAAREANASQDTLKALAIKDPGTAEQYLVLSDEKITVIDKMAEILGWMTVGDLNDDEVLIVVDQDGIMRAEFYTDDAYSQLARQARQDGAVEGSVEDVFDLDASAWGDLLSPEQIAELADQGLILGSDDEIAGLSL